MGRRKGRKKDLLVLFVLALTAVFLLAFMEKRFYLNCDISFSPDMEVSDNPLMGYAPYAENEEKCENSSLVFIKLKWSDWEPEKGYYDRDFLESRYHLSRWKEAGKRGVLRFSCDEPGTAGHGDIPQWLLAETGDGVYYTVDSGSGYCPNYENPYFIDRHQKAVAALAAFFNEYDFLSYVELGSLGYWGEWHCRDENGNSQMPSPETCWDYVLHYSDSFRNVRFLMRRSYVYAVESGMGLYHDVFGDEKETERFRSWILSGGMQDTSGEPIPILPYPLYWETAPAGGELTSGVEMDTLMQEGLSSLLHQIEQCRLTFLGPHCPDREEYPSAYDAILRRLGYRYYVSRLSGVFSFRENALVLTMDWENAGVAPLYWDYPVTVKILDAQNNPVYWEMLELPLSQLTPGKVITTTTIIPYLDALREGYSVGVSVTDQRGEGQLRLAMEAEALGDCQILYRTAGG